MIKNELKNIKAGSRELRNFGLMVGAVFTAIGLALFFLGRGANIALFAIGLVILFFGAIIPRVLYLPYRAWMGFAIVMGWIMSRLILTILFFVVITLIGFIARAIGKDFLGLRRRPDARSYWQKRESITSKEQYEKQF